MTTLKVRRVLTGLASKGFSLSPGDHKHLIFFYEGKKTSIRTKISRGNSEIHDSLISKMAKQVKLNKRKFIDLIDCPLTAEAYIKELKSQGISF